MKPYRSTPSFSEQQRRQSGGFTLIEILVAISIVAILLTSIYGIFSTVSSAKDRLDTDSEAYHRARVIFDRLGRELRGAYYTASNKNTRFRGGTDSDRRPFLELSTTAVSPLSSTGTGFALVHYRLEEDAETNDGSKIMLRREAPLLASEETLDEDAAMRLAPGISRFQVRFYAEAAWHDNWEAAGSGLPEMVEVLLYTIDAEGEETPFLTAFELPDARMVP